MEGDFGKDVAQSEGEESCFEQFRFWLPYPQHEMPTSSIFGWTTRTERLLIISDQVLISLSIRATILHYMASFALQKVRYAWV
jgi:hypothetical protein